MSRDKFQPIIVYNDFTKLAYKSLEWAYYMARKSGFPVLQVHAIDHNTPNHVKGENLDIATRKRMEEDAAAFSDVFTRFEIMEGCNCTIINEMAERYDAVFSICAVHGLNDPQYLSAQVSVKMIRNSRSPFLIISKNTPPPRLHTIDFIVRLDKHIKVLSPWLLFLVQHSEAKLQLHYSRAIKEDLAHNLQFIKKILKEGHVLPEENTHDKQSDKIRKELLKENAEGRMHVLLFQSKKHFMEGIFGNPDAKLLNNKNGIPVFCMTARKDLYVPCI